MFVFNSHNKENKTLGKPSDHYYFKDKSKRNYLSQRSIKKSSNITRSRQENSYNSYQESKFKGEKAQLNQSSLTSSVLEEKNKVKQKNIKLKLRNPLSVNEEHYHNTLVHKSNFNCQQPLKRSENLKVNKSDLKLKSPLVKQALFCKSKNKKHFKFENLSFDFSEGKVNEFHNTKINRTEREAFNIFRFPKQQTVKSRHLSVIGSMDKKSVHDDRKNSEIHSSLFKKNLSSMVINQTETEGTYSAAGNSNTTEIKIMSQSIPENSLTNNCQANSPLRNMGSVVRWNSKTTSPILDTKKNETSAFHVDFVKAEESLSPILSSDVCSFKKIIQNIKVKNLHLNAFNRNPDVFTQENEMFSCPNTSPVLDSSRQTKDTVMYPFKTDSCESNIRCKIDPDASPSPVLDASQLKKPVAKLNNMSVGENVLKDHKDMKKVEYSSKLNRGLEKEVKHKRNNSNVLLRPFLIKGSTNEGYSIDQSKLNPLEKCTEPLSQVLDSNQRYHYQSEDCCSTNSKWNRPLRPASLHIVPDPVVHHPLSTLKLTNTVSCMKNKEEEKNNRPPLDKLDVINSHDELKESCSPVLDSSQLKKNCSEKQTIAETSKSPGNCSKTNICSQSPELKNYCSRHYSNLLKEGLPPTKLINSSISSCELKNKTVDSLTCCNQLKTSNKKYNSRSSDFTTLEQLTECQLPNLIPNYSKRLHSPIVGSKLKCKKPKTKADQLETEYEGPMLSLITQSPATDNGLCPIVSPQDQYEDITCSPSFNSDLDIRKFPIMFSGVTDQCSPKESAEKIGLLTDKSSGIILPSQNQARESKVTKHFKYSCQDDLKSKNYTNPNKVPMANSYLNVESPYNPSTHNPETMSPILSKSDAFQNLISLTSNNQSDLQSFAILGTKETHMTNQNQFSETNCNHEFIKSQETSKGKVKKNLSLYYEEKIPVSNSHSKISTNMCNETIISHTKDDEALEDKVLANCSQISGVGKLQTSPCEHADGEKLLIVYENPKKKEQKPLMLENDFLNHKSINIVEPFISNKNYQIVNAVKRVNAEDKQEINWKNKSDIFDCTEDIRIEDFDEESPVDKENFEVTIETSKLESVKRNLHDHFEISPSCSVTRKQTVPEVKHLLRNFEPDNQSKNTREYISPEDEIEIENEGREVEIEDFTQRTCERSPGFRIEYSATPTVKSSEGTQNETSSNPLSFPPALDVKNNPSSEVLDSACKNQRAKVKRGSAVERLRRLIRAQRAEVNMFHHEASSQARARARACSLSVVSTLQTCSLLVVNCRYVDAQRSASQEFGSGEEVVDPEVHVYVDPSYTKNISAGSILTVFPPWHSVWHERRGVVVMYCVTKLQLTSTNQSLPAGRISLTSCPIHACNTQMEFSCQFRDDHCKCRSQLVSQLFTAPPQLRRVQSAGGVDGAITSALAGGWFPQRVKLVLTVLHSFQSRSYQNKVLTRLLCVDAGGNICQVNFRSEQDVLKMGPLKDAINKQFAMKKLTVCSRIFIDRCKGLRSFLTYLHAESTNQQVLYIATPSSDDWLAQLIDRTADSNTSADIHSKTHDQHRLLSLPVNEDVEGRAKARVKVMAVRRDELFAWDPLHDSYFKLNITSSAKIPNFPVRSCLDLVYLWAHQGELTIDKFTEVSVVEGEVGDSPTIPPLAVDSNEGSLVLLDSIVTKVSSEAYLRWEGVCGHKVLRVQKTGMFFCLTCRETSAFSTQKVVLEVCVAVVDFPYPIRVKVKSETARVLLADTSGQISSEKSYNMIGVIGSPLKCLTLVSEVLRNSLGDIIEFILEEL